MEDGDVVAWQLLLERADNARCGESEGVLQVFDRLEFRRHADGKQHLWVAKMADTPVGGIFTMSGAEFGGVPEQWLPYLAVDDVDARLKAAKAAGAVVLREPFEVPGVGRIAIIQDPGGAAIGWMTPASQ
jgi:predicted enzyme related to lactoylglutathione lyase